MEDEQEQRRRKVEAGRAKLAHFRQRKTKGDCAHSKKKTAKRKGPAVDAPVQEESAVAAADGGLVGGPDVCSDTPDGGGAAQLGDAPGERPEDPERPPQQLDSTRQEQPGVVTKPVPPLELEALRLSLSHAHAAQLERTQAALQREKEAALSELRAALLGRLAQERALLQSGAQRELELVREQHGRETAELKEKLRSEMEKNVQMIEALKQDWESERDLCLENLRRELLEKHQLELENLQNQFQKELAEQRAELEKIFQAPSQAECSPQTPEAQHEAAPRPPHADLPPERCPCLGDVELKFKEKEKENQLELENLRASYEELQARSQEEIRRLGAQLESARSSRQELSELHEQLLARASHLEELEHLKRDFELQQQQERTKHESELEGLRVYFEEKLREAERGHQEDLALLEQRLQEGKEGFRLQPVETSASLDGTPEPERGDRPDGWRPGLERQEDVRLSLPLEENHRCQLAVWQSSQEVQLEAGLVGTQVLEGERHAGLSGEPGSELAQATLLCAQSAASDVGTEVADGVSGLETECKAQPLLVSTEFKEEIDILKAENRNLREKLQDEIRLREDLEKVKRDLLEGHQEELRRSEQKIELLKRDLGDREAAWQVTCEELGRAAEERLSRRLLELREQAESEKRSLTNRFELREAEMRQLQDRQAAQILDLEGSLVEQQGRLRQLELGLAGDESLRCSRCGRELGSPGPADQDGELATLHLQEPSALQPKPAQSRLLGERRAVTARLAAEQDAVLREARETQARQLQLLQEQHQQQVLSVTAELEARHQAQMQELKASLEREQWALSEARAAELQAEHAAAVGALETSHASHLDSLAARHLSEVQALQGRHRRALQLLRAELEEQLREDASPREVLTRVFKKLKLERDEEPPCAGDGPELPGACQGELESEEKAAFHEKEVIHKLEHEQAQSLYQKEKESLSLQLQEKNNQILQLKDQILSLRHEVEARHSELERLQQRRERENQEGAHLVAMLRADVSLSLGERRALQDALRRLLGLFGETLKAAVALKSRISEHVGLCLEDESPPDGQPGAPTPPAAPALDETWPWPDAAPPELDGTSPDGAEASSVAEISSHICESFFMSPESTLECEQPVRRVFQSLGLAVDSLLEMVLDSSRQLEEARQIHSRFEEEFSCKKEEMAQVVGKQQELLERLDAEHEAKARLELQLHKAEGIIEGFKEEKASLQEALGQKEASEQGLVVELEGLRQQLQRAARQQAELQEANSALWSQKEALAAAAGEREAALRRDVESLTQEQAEARKQAEKDRSVLLSQMRALEADLEEQLSRQQACAQQAAELCALRQQLEALDQHLRRQRQFMDEQAVEREHEREDFQQEIQRLEEQLRQAARPWPRGPHDRDRAQLDEEVELLEEKLREKSDGLNELIVKKELADRQVLTQEEEIKRLEEANASSRRELAQLQGELERLRKTLRDLEQDKEVSQGQQRSNLLLVSTPQSKLDEGKCPVPPVGGSSEGPEVQLEAVQRVLLQREDEVLDLKQQLEKVKDDLVSKNEEVLHLNSKLDLQHSSIAASIRELQEENASLKAAHTRSPEIEELRSVIETLRQNQERLQRERAEETEQLHEVIEKLQRELSLAEPARHEVSDGGAGNLRSELLGLGAEGAEARAALEGELHAALEAKEALSRQLAEQEREHGRALAALQQRLRAAEEAAARQLRELQPSAALREAEVQGLASQIRAFEAALAAKGEQLAAREAEVAALTVQRSAHASELEALLSAVARFRRALERQPLAPAAEPPELQRLRAQCVRLGRQLQALTQRFPRCQKELDEQPAQGAGLPPCGAGSSQGQGPRAEEASCAEEPGQDVGSRQLAKAPHGQASGPQSPGEAAKAQAVLNRAGPRRQDSVLSALTACQRQLESELLLVRKDTRWCAEDGEQVSETVKDKEKLLEDCHLRKADLVTQVKQLQEKLNRLVCSMSFQKVEMEDFKFQQALASLHVLENSLSGSSSDGEETHGSPPVSVCSDDDTTWDLTDVTGNQDALIKNKTPDDPMAEPVASQDGSGSLRESWHGCSHDLANTEGPEPVKNMLRTMDLSSWSSPEVARKDSTLEPLPSLPLTPCSDALSQRSLDTSLWDGPSTWLLQADQSGLLCYPDESAAGMAPRRAASPLAADRAPSADRPAQRVAVEKDVEDFIITSLESQPEARSSPPGPAGKNEGDGSGFGETLDPGSGSLGAPTAGPAAPSAPGGCRQPPGTMKEKGVHPKRVKALLQMVCDESHHILALSECHGPSSILSRGEPRGPLEAASTPVPRKGEKEPSDVALDWRREFLQVVQEAFEKEREVLKARLCGSDPGGYSSVLERVVQEQGDLQERSLEHLRLSDRSSLLSEIQALRAQLRLTHLQNQEKLQQLCAALTSVEARGSRQEHQLRRQVELLAYKVEQEKRIASDLQRTLSEEQEKASAVQKLLAVERGSVSALRAELCECRADNERLLRSLNDVQKEVLQLRSVLDSKEEALQAALQQLESQRGKERALQGRLEEERLQHLQREGQSAKTVEELRASLEKQQAQSNQLCVALKHEQTAKDNLRKELQIEASRCEALLAQERSHLSELQRSLEAEQGRSRELAEALHHERRLTERLSRRTQEKQVHEALLQKLKGQEARVLELEAALQTALQRALEAEARPCREEVKREQEVSAAPRPPVEAPQTLARRRERPARAQAEVEQPRAAQAEQAACKDTRPGAEPRPSRMDADKWRRWQRDKEMLRELALQHQRDEHKIRQLRARELRARELQAREAARPCPEPEPEPESLREQQQGLETARQQLLCAAGLLTSFINQTVDRTLSDWTSSNEKAVASLLHTLETLKSDLGSSGSCHRKTAAALQARLVDVLLSDNESLRRALSTVTREKAELCRALSQLERSPRASRALQESCTRRMEKLYLHYLRAESFRKALIYQKKYLLLLIGGFQDSEQETLSMIAHLGVFPSQADKKAPASRPLARFRTAVRVVVAVLRLRFLVKKWQQVDGRGALAPGRAPRPAVAVPRRQRSPPDALESPPTRDVSSSHARDPVRKASPCQRDRSSPAPNPRSERSLSASQDPERSLTEYIHHLEMIQQRLGAVPPDSTSKKSCQKIKQ
ncbi:pericentrin isoform X3 [Phacochoerus africanus]|uniref:pericentrin isoform X3 n=1 Tax=Phacochoerus africanus TaxID=41426 RepID=UPI001FD904F5|nr:pericentrin isoform X3 [Phacochoerus africanus]